MFENKSVVMATPARLGDTLMCTPAIHLLKFETIYITGHGLNACGLRQQCALDCPFGHTNLTRTGPYPKLKDLMLIQGLSMEAITVTEVFQTVVNKL